MKQLKQLSLLALLVLTAATAHARIDLTALRDAARSRDVVAIQRMADDARGEPLEMYPRYYLISTQITQISPDDVNAFFERFDGSPLADRLRLEWLRELGKRQDWARFFAGVQQAGSACARPAVSGGTGADGDDGQCQSARFAWGVV